MIDLEVLRQENQRWHQQHAEWVEEAQKWQRETQRLAALLYLLDRALPEHSAVLAKHISLIEQYEDIVSCYECGIKPECLKTCESYKSIEEQEQFHTELCQFHAETEQKHENLKNTFQLEMENFKRLANELINQLRV